MPWAANPSLMSTPTAATTTSQPASNPEAGLSQSATSSQGLPEGFRPPRMYATADTSKSPIRLWRFPYTLAGDGGLSIPIQCTITWWLEVWLVNRHLRRGRLQAIGFMPEPKTRFFRWFMFLNDRPVRNHERRGSRMMHWLLFASSHFARALIVSAVAFTVVWAPSVGVLMLVSLNGGERKLPPGCEHDWCYKKKWAPQIFKSVKGSVLGILTTPLFVIFWLVRCGWALKKNEAHYGER
ncbi:hypothetical protein DL764_000174 [Monosporascus ibericus]|uniref:Uncharacterized protein n=1 Tax=Monosporascus ibericus TaxID=155417 RepID=A0A4Q4TWH7_9PEZI|nr:hypothetical protein DL764_000174 [Monosporascus ibericus]